MPSSLGPHAVLNFFEPVMTCHLLCFNFHRSTGSKEDRISLVSAVQREVFNTLKQSEPYVTQFPGVNDMTVRAAQTHLGRVIMCGSCSCEGNTTYCHAVCRQLQQQRVSGPDLGSRR